MSHADLHDPPRCSNLGEVFRLAPSFANVQRLTSGSVQRPSSASRVCTQQPSQEVVLEPLPPPRVVSSPLEEKQFVETNDNQKFLDERLRLMGKSRPVSAPFSNTPSSPSCRKASPSRHKSKPSRFARETRDRLRRQDVLYQSYSGSWGDLNPFDPVQNPNAHKLLTQRSMSPPRPGRSSSRDHDLESFRPSFRTEWLIALRNELLKGTREENKKLRKDFDTAIASAVAELRVGYDAAVLSIRKDYEDAVADIRHDFIDAFVEGDISHMIEAAKGKRREVDVNFAPVFAEIENLKSSVLEAVENNHSALSSSLMAETTKSVTESVTDLTRSMSNDFGKIFNQIESANSSTLEEIRSHKVDFSPVLAAIDAVDRDVVDLGPLLDSVKYVEDKLDCNVKKILDAVDDAPHGSILHQIDEVKARLEQDNLMLVNAIEKVGADIDEHVGSLKSIGEASLTCVEKLDLDSAVSHLETALAKSGGQIEETVKKNAKPPDFSVVLAAIAKLDLGALSRQIDTRYSDTCKCMESSILKPVVEAVNARNVDINPILERISEVIKLQDILSRVVAEVKGSIAEVKGSVGEVKVSAIETKRMVATPDFTPVLQAMPPPTDLLPVLEAIGKVDVRPEVHVNLQEILDALGKVGPDLRKALTEIVGDLSAKSKADMDRLVSANAQISSDVCSHSHKMIEAVGDVKQCSQVAHENVLKTLARDAEKVADAFQQSVARRDDGVQQVLKAIASIEEVDLHPMLQELKDIEKSVSAFHTATLNAIQGIHVDPVDFAPILSEMESNKVALSQSLNLSALETKAGLEPLLETLLDKVNCVASNTSIDVLGPLQKSIDGIDVNPVVDLQPILEAIDNIELNPVMKVDTKPFTQLMTTGLAKIELAWAKVDNTEVLEAIKAIHTRILEAIVKIDAKDPARSPNFIWASEAAKWT